MTTPSLHDVVQAAHDLWPVSLAEDWDASGLVSGYPEAPVERILFAVDAVQGTAREAVEAGCQLLITHHPLLMRGASFLPASSDKGRVVHTLIEGGCGLLASHTNADSMRNGVSDALIEACGVTEARPLGDPEGETGIGRVGDLPQEVSLHELAMRLASVLQPTAGGLRIAGPKDGRVRRVAVCGGAGDSLFDVVRAESADVYVTADLRHHPASEARERALLQGGTPYLVDCSHFASEELWLARGAKMLEVHLSDQGFEVEILLSSLNTDPWDFSITPNEVPVSASTDPEGSGYAR
ncbi:Nif3-like dinuclear metal center hexameric protein [Kocuria sp. HSID16901]|uniref:Nif3-like dinuclear metal center hexameric protein n=1 Tax=Kocuria sp. HSID16901 TaxID=2419505 RepID=UPI00066141F1|nr:Nif3-like dinuclear metal center hexameric protein [Kocuria sp. HSID16901]RUQ22486.1 Nif3-like dinuclear metal center hexameric protein [Kocuria sp. HSID16901]